jgi:hypothetical protein
MSIAIDLEIDRNMFAFQSQLAGIIDEHRGQFALLRDQKIVEIFGSLRKAIDTAHQKFSDGRYSIQEVTDQPVDLGFYSHVENLG